MSDLVTVSEAARRLGLNHSTVSRQVRKLGLQVDARGEFDLAAYQRARETSLAVTMRRDRPIDAGLLSKIEPASTDATPAASPAASGPTVVTAMTEHKQLQAELLRMQIARERGELVDRAEVDEAYMTAARTLRDAMLALPARVAQEVVGMTDAVEVKRVLEARVREMLAALAGELEGAAMEDQAAA